MDFSLRAQVDPVSRVERAQQRGRFAFARGVVSQALQMLGVKLMVRGIAGIGPHRLRQRFRRILMEESIRRRRARRIINGEAQRGQSDDAGDALKSPG